MIDSNSLIVVENIQKYTIFSIFKTLFKWIFFFNWKIVNHLVLDVIITAATKYSKMRNMS